MELTLSRKLDVLCFEVFAEVAKAEKRQEIQAVLLLAQENGGRITPELICTKLLGGRPPVVGRTILQRCKLLHLVEGDDNESFLTAEGRESASRGMVFVPEKGKYRLWVTDDPLFIPAALDLEPLKEQPLTRDNVYESERAHGRRGGGPPQPGVGQAQDMRAQAERLKGQVFTPLKPDAQPYLLNFIGPEWVYIESPEVARPSRITWTVRDSSLGRVQVDGAFTSDTLSPPSIPFDQIWLGLLGSNQKDWDTRDDGTYLRCSFEGDGLTDADKLSFQRTLVFDHPEIPELGRFDALEVESVPIAPRTENDAQEWGGWLLEKRVTTYQDNASFAALQREVHRAFPEFDVSLPSRSQLLRRLVKGLPPKAEGRYPPSYWFLQAPQDLAEGGSLIATDDEEE